MDTRRIFIYHLIFLKHDGDTWQLSVLGHRSNVARTQDPITYIYRGWVKKVTPKFLNNILAYAKPFWVKLCPVIGNLCPHMCTKFGEFTLNNEFRVHFSLVTPFLLFQILSVAVEFRTFTKNTNADSHLASLIHHVVSPHLAQSLFSLTGQTLPILFTNLAHQHQSFLVRNDFTDSSTVSSKHIQFFLF